MKFATAMALKGREGSASGKGAVMMPFAEWLYVQSRQVAKPPIAVSEGKVWRERIIERTEL